MGGSRTLAKRETYDEAFSKRRENPTGSGSLEARTVRGFKEGTIN